MKTTVEVSDHLLERARARARQEGSTLRMLIEQGLRHVLDQPPLATTYELQDCRVGDPQSDNPLNHLSWPELRSEIYGEQR